jgi:hypothetical protein
MDSGKSQKTPTVCQRSNKMVWLREEGGTRKGKREMGNTRCGNVYWELCGIAVENSGWGMDSGKSQKTPTVCQRSNKMV